jgi:LacI family transcriptional regulator
VSGRVTLQQVAERARTSRTTAHYVLTGQDQEMRISEDARARVLRAAAELRYRPNLMARGLRTAVTQTIALVSDSIAAEVYAGDLVLGSLVAAAARQHLLFVAETADDPALESSLVEGLLDRHVDGFLYASLYTRDVHLPAVLAGQRVVTLNCRSADGAVPAVVPDEEQGGRSAARTLLEAGHRDGIHLVGESAQHLFAGRERLRGVTAELGAAGAGLAGQVECTWWPEAAFDAVDRWLATGVRPAALICMNDRVAFGAYQALAAHGLQVPRDVSVVAFDDSELASWVRPQLTGIALPHRVMAERAVAVLLDGQESPLEHRVPMPVRRRASVAPPR